MTDYTTIRVTKDAIDKAREAKHDDETWNEYIQRCTEQPPEIVEYVEASSNDTTTDIDIDYTHLADKVAREVVTEMEGRR